MCRVSRLMSCEAVHDTIFSKSPSRFIVAMRSDWLFILSLAAAACTVENVATASAASI